MDDQPIIIGIDEAGRGPVFGPMVIGASCNISGWQLAAVKDSKLVKSEDQRRMLDRRIRENTIWATAVVSADVINQFGTQRTLKVAGKKIATEMFQKLRAKFPSRKIRIIFDGRDHPNTVDGDLSIESIEKADSTIFEVSCASLIAKVLHDNMIHDIVKSDPQRYGPYDLDSCKGYGTAAHKAALIKHGLTPYHRKVACTTLLTPKSDRRLPYFRKAGSDGASEATAQIQGIG